MDTVKHELPPELLERALACLCANGHRPGATPEVYVRSYQPPEVGFLPVWCVRCDVCGMSVEVVECHGGAVKFDGHAAVNRCPPCDGFVVSRKKERT